MQNFQLSEDTLNFLDLENAALMYSATMDHWAQCRQIMPLDVHTIRYEDMVEDLERELRPLIEFIGLEWHENLLEHQSTARSRAHIRTPSYSQVTEGIYSRSSGRWRKYRRHLEPVIPILNPWIEAFGYTAED